MPIHIYNRYGSALGKLFAEEGGGAAAGAWGGGEGFGRAGEEDATAATATVGAHVDEVVGALDNVEVVLDDDDGVALVDELVEDAE